MNAETTSTPPLQEVLPPSTTGRMYVELHLNKKTADLLRFSIAQKPIRLLSSTVVSHEDASAVRSFRTTPNLEDPGTGDFRALDLALSGALEMTHVEVFCDVKHLMKGDKFNLLSSFYPYGIKKLIVKLLDPEGSFETVHEKADIPGNYSFYLTWPWA